MLLVYTDQRIVNGRLYNFENKDIEYTATNNLEEYLASNNPRKVAISYQKFGLNLDQADPANVKHFVDSITCISQASDLVAIVETELHNECNVFFNCPNNVYWLLPGLVTDNPDFSKQVIFNGEFLTMVRSLYLGLDSKLSELTPYTTKPKSFDALLGSVKPHRTEIYNLIKQNQLDDQIVMTYDPDSPHGSSKSYKSDYFIWEPGTTLIDTGNLEAPRTVEYQGRRTQLSFVIPIQLFNNTAYSLVAETDNDNLFSFFTEKIVKPMVARRLFVVFSGYKFLYNLRQLGFQTFDGIIDESYDLIADPEQRLTAAFEQVKWLCKQDQQTILSQIQPIVEHNYQLLMSKDWQDSALGKVISLIKTIDKI